MTGGAASGDLFAPAAPDLIAVERAQLPLGALVLGCVASVAIAIALSGFDLSLNRLLLALCFGIIVPFMVHQIREVGIFSPGALLGLGFIHVNLIIPTEIEIDPELPHFLAAITPPLNSAQIARPLIATACGAAGLLVGWSLGVAPRREAKESYWALPAAAPHMIRGGLIIFGVGVVAYFLGITLATGSPLGLYGVSYDERVEVVASIGQLGYGINLIYAGAMGAVAALLGTSCAPEVARRRNLTALLILVAFGIHSVLGGAKVHLFLVGFAALTAWQTRARREGQRTKGKLALMGVAGVLAVVLLAIGPMRSRLGLGVGEMLRFTYDMFDVQFINPANIDAYGPYMTMLDVVNDRVLVGPTYGRSYVAAVLHVPPGSLVPDRDRQLHVQYADHMMPKGAPTTASFAFNAIAEGYLAFGFVGSFLQLALIGWLGGAVTRILRATRGSARALVLAAFSAPWLAMALRTNTDSLLREVVVTMLLPVLLVDWIAVRLTARARGVGASLTSVR